MSTNALPSQGCLLQVGSIASPIVYTTISDTVSFSGPDGTKGEIDTTDVAATAKTFIGSLPDFGSISFSLNYIPTNTQHAQIVSDFESSTSVERRYKILFSDSPQTAKIYTGYISGFGPNVEVDSALTASGSIRITGVIS